MQDLTLFDFPLTALRVKSAMDIRCNSGLLRVVLLTVWVTLVAACTETNIAYIRVAKYDSGQVEHHVLRGLEELGWRLDEKVASAKTGSIVYRHPVLSTYYIGIRHAKGEDAEIAFVGVGEREFSSDAVDAYKSLVTRLATDLGELVKYDRQTSSGQNLTK